MTNKKEERISKGYKIAYSPYFIGDPVYLKDNQIHRALKKDFDEWVKTEGYLQLPLKNVGENIEEDYGFIHDKNTPIIMQTKLDMGSKSELIIKQ